MREALVVHGSGLDEIALHGETRAIRLSDGEMTEIELTPEEAGFERAPLSVVTGGDAEENALRLAPLLAGSGTRAENDIVALNAGALADDRGQGGRPCAKARRWRATPCCRGRAGAVLDAYVEASNG